MVLSTGQLLGMAAMIAAALAVAAGLTWLDGALRPPRPQTPDSQTAPSAPADHVAAPAEAGRPRAKRAGHSRRRHGR